MELSLWADAMTFSVSEHEGGKNVDGCPHHWVYTILIGNAPVDDPLFGGDQAKIVLYSTKRIEALAKKE